MNLLHNRGSENSYIQYDIYTLSLIIRPDKRRSWDTTELKLDKHIKKVNLIQIHSFQRG